VNKENNVQKQIEETKKQHHENRHRSTGREKHAPIPRALLASSYLQKPRSTQNEAGYANRDPHALIQGWHSPARAGHASLRKEPYSSIEWLPKPEEAGDHYRKAPVNEHPAEAYRSRIKAKLHWRPPTSAIPIGQSLDPSVFTNNNQTKQQNNKEKTPTSPDLTPRGATAPQP
jgi:hypothetical protein